MTTAIASVGSKIAQFSRKYPIVRGMVSYGLIWPGSSLIQQTVDGKTWKTYDWKECARYSFYGSCITAPTLYLWVRISTRFWPSSDIGTALLKAAVEQITYGPAAMSLFFFSMSILKGRTVDESVDEVKTKFLPTYKVAILFWPVLQTINFGFVPEKNRVVFVSVCSLIWASFLAHMKEKPQEELAEMTSSHQA